MKTQHVNKDLSGLDSCKLAADLLTKPLPPVNWLLLLRGRLIWGWGGVRGRELFGRLLFFFFFFLQIANIVRQWEKSGLVLVAFTFPDICGDQRVCN